MHKFSVFVINLESSPDRLAAVDAQLSRQGILFERVRGVEGKGMVPARWQKEFNHALDMTGGEIGCYASHLQVCEEILNDGYACALVLEDDVLIGKDFAKLVEEVVICAPEGWDVIHLSTNFKRPAFPICTLKCGRQLVRYARLPVNSAGYLISRSGAAKLLAPGARKWPIDLEFRFAWHRGLEIFGVYPSPIRQRPDVTSTIGHRSQLARNRFSLKRLAFEPGLLSRAKGWFYVRRRLGVAGTIYCLLQGLKIGGKRPLGQRQKYPTLQDDGAAEPWP